MFKIGIKVKNIKNHIIETLFQGKESPTVIIVPYGQFINAPDDLPVGILSDQGHAESLYGFVMDLENLEDLEEGEIAFGIPSLKARIHFDKDGNVSIKNENGKITLKEDGELSIVLDKSIATIKPDGNFEYANDNGVMKMEPDGKFTANGFTVDV